MFHAKPRVAAVIAVSLGAPLHAAYANGAASVKDSRRISVLPLPYQGPERRDIKGARPHREQEYHRPADAEIHQHLPQTVGYPEH